MEASVDRHAILLNVGGREAAKLLTELPGRSSCAVPVMPNFVFGLL